MERPPGGGEKELNTHADIYLTLTMKILCWPPVRRNQPSVAQVGFWWILPHKEAFRCWKVHLASYLIADEFQLVAFHAPPLTLLLSALSLRCLTA